MVKKKPYKIDKDFRRKVKEYDKTIAKELSKQRQFSMPIIINPNDKIPEWLTSDFKPKDI